jgi:hypothetical protein
MRSLLLFLVVFACFNASAQYKLSSNYSIAGVYKSKTPCADCENIETTLKLKCELPCHSGSYVLTDRYFNSPEGQVLSKKRGKWSILEKNSDNTMVIVLDKDDPEMVSYFFVKKDGDMQPLDKNKQVVEGPYDVTLRKQ